MVPAEVQWTINTCNQAACHISCVLRSDMQALHLWVSQQQAGHAARLC